VNSVSKRAIFVIVGGLSRSSRWETW